MIGPLLLTFSDAGKVLGGASASTVRRMVKHTVFKPVKVGRRVFLAIDDVHAYIEKQRAREDNGSCAGRDVPEGDDTCRSARNVIRTESSSDRTVLSGGLPSPTDAAAQLDDLLGLGATRTRARSARKSPGRS